MYDKPTLKYKLLFKNANDALDAGLEPNSLTI